jgi:hypothetical protein
MGFLKFAKPASRAAMRWKKTCEPMFSLPSPSHEGKLMPMNAFYSNLDSAFTVKLLLNSK